MPHVFEPAATGRSKCRGCRQLIQKGMIRFGESLPNPFADGEAMYWFHPGCAAYKRPEALLEGLGAAQADLPEREILERSARTALEKPRLPRIDGAERSPSSQARCRQCQQPIEKGTWRIRLVFHEEGTFSPGGFLHMDCRQAYFETEDILAQLMHFSHSLDEAERTALQNLFSATQATNAGQSGVPTD